MNPPMDGEENNYFGCLMAGYYDHKAATQHTCVDESVEQISGSGLILIENCFIQLKQSVVALIYSLQQ